MTDSTASRLPAEIEAFLTELRNDTTLGSLVDTLEIAFRAIDLAGDSVADAIRFQDGVIWVLKHKDRTVLERIEALTKLANADGAASRARLSFRACGNFSDGRNEKGGGFLRGGPGGAEIHGGCWPAPWR
jgi:hypothetical protein